MSSSNCCFLTCIQISQEAGQVAWYSHHFQNFPQFIVIHTIKAFGIVNKAETDFFLELSCFFDDPVDVGNLISGYSAFSKTSLNIWKFMVHVLLKPGLENFEHYFTSVWDGLWLYHSNPCFCLHIDTSSVCVCLSLIRTLVVVFGTNWIIHDTTTISKSLITSAKVLFPNKVIFPNKVK